MAQDDRVSRRHVDVVDELSREDRDWLRARLEEYRDLLQYLHDH